VIFLLYIQKFSERQTGRSPAMPLFLSLVFFQKYFYIVLLEGYM